MYMVHNPSKYDDVIGEQPLIYILDLCPFVNIHNKFEYRHMMLPKDLAMHVPKTHLMSSAEWRNLGVQQSPDLIFMLFIGQLFLHKNR